MRFSKTFPVGDRVRLEGMVDAFNLFNHRNHNVYVLNESKRSVRAAVGRGARAQTPARIPRDVLTAARRYNEGRAGIPPGLLPHHAHRS